MYVKNETQRDVNTYLAGHALQNDIDYVITPLSLVIFAGVMRSVSKMQYYISNERGYMLVEIDS